MATELGLRIDEAVTQHLVVNWPTNLDARNQMINAAEDALLEVSQQNGFELSVPVLDEIEREVLRIAEAHYGER